MTVHLSPGKASQDGMIGRYRIITLGLPFSREMALHFLCELLQKEPMLESDESNLERVSLMNPKAQRQTYNLRSEQPNAEPACFPLC